MELIYCGLYLLKGPFKYLWIHHGPETFLKEDKKRSVLEISFKESQNSLEVSKALGIPHKGAPRKVYSMPYPEKIHSTTVTLNGLRFRKLTYDPHTIRIVIAADNESKVVQDYKHTTIVVSEGDLRDKGFWEYILFSGGLTYFVPDIPKSKFSPNWIPGNYPSIVVTNTSLTLESLNYTPYHLRNKYDQYLIRSIDYIEQFLVEIKKILDDYGVELVRYNREKTLSNTSYVSYRITQTPSSALHPGYSDLMENLYYKRLPIELELRSTNAQLFYDFKTKYTNVDLLSNFCEYKTTDKYGERWTSAVKWGRISEDFNHTYDMDSNANFSYQCSFGCELFFTEAPDKSVEFIKEILLDLDSTDQVEEELNRNEIKV